MKTKSPRSNSARATRKYDAINDPLRIRFADLPAALLRQHIANQKSKKS